LLEEKRKSPKKDKKRTAQPAAAAAGLGSQVCRSTSSPVLYLEFDCAWV